MIREYDGILKQILKFRIIGGTDWQTSFLKAAARKMS
jgi:hypothetical protein